MRQLSDCRPDGYEVVGARRSINKLPADLPGIAIDITRPETLTALAQQTWYAVIVTLTADSFNREAYQATYVDGLNNVLKSLESRGKRCISSCAAGYIFLLYEYLSSK